MGFHEPRCYSFGFIWVQDGVGLTLSTVRHWRRLNFSWPQNFPKIDQKTNNANKKCTRTCKKDLGPAGPKVDATVTEQNVDATVKAIPQTYDSTTD